MLTRLLLMVNNASLLGRIEQLAGQLDVAEVLSSGRGDFWAAVRAKNADVVVVGYDWLPDPPLETIAALRELPDQPEIVILWNHTDPLQQARLTIAGASLVLSPDLPDLLLRDSLQTVIRRRAQMAEQQAVLELGEHDPRLADFDSTSPLMQQFVATVQRVVASDSTLLLLGESGVGKEHLARAIHAESPRAFGAFVAVNCGALPESLLESELFGHEEGAFTGAVRSRRGYFELAHKGTILLDEIGELPPHVQIRLLRVLQERKIQRLGSEEPVSIDVRVMAATNRDLTAEVEAGRFRQDLYYRLGVVTMELPPLRERPEDILPLLATQLEGFRTRFGRDVARFTPIARDALVRYPWPGNVRELINVVERAVLLAPGREITLEDLPPAIAGHRSGGSLAGLERTSGEGLPDLFGGDWEQRPWREVRQRVVQTCERAYLAKLLAATGGHIGKTAHQAGITPRALNEKMRRLGLAKETYRRAAGEE